MKKYGKFNLNNRKPSQFKDESGTRKETELRTYLNHQLVTGGGNNTMMIHHLVEKDFSRICSSKYHKYRNSLNLLQIEKEDFVGECYLVFFRRLWDKKKSMMRIADNPRAFLNNFIESRALDLSRKKAPVIYFENRENYETVFSGKSAFYGASEYKNPEELLLNKDKQNKVRNVFRQLSTADQKLLDMRIIQRLKPKEISNRSEQNISCVYDRIKQARKNLKSVYFNLE